MKRLERTDLCCKKCKDRFENQRKGKDYLWTGNIWISFNNVVSSKRKSVERGQACTVPEHIFCAILLAGSKALFRCSEFVEIQLYIICCNLSVPSDIWGTFHGFFKLDCLMYCSTFLRNMRSFQHNDRFWWRSCKPNCLNPAAGKPNSWLSRFLQTSFLDNFLRFSAHLTKVSTLVELFPMTHLYLQAVFNTTPLHHPPCAVQTAA